MKSQIYSTSMTHIGYECGKEGIFENKQLDTYVWAGNLISYLFMFLCIAHPICLCVAMIG